MSRAHPQPADIQRAAELAWQLCSLVTHTHGTSGAAFRDLPAEQQDAYMWAVADVCEALVKALHCRGVVA